MEIRKATLADAVTISALNATVQNLHAAAHPHIFKPASDGAFSPDEVAQISQNPENTVFVAFVDGAAAGYLYASIVRREETSWRHALVTCNIAHISVDAGYQGRGVGSALIAAAKALAAEACATFVELDVWAFNAHARAFFERQGFEGYNLRMWTEVADAD